MYLFVTCHWSAFHSLLLTYLLSGNPVEAYDFLSWQAACGIIIQCRSVFIHVDQYIGHYTYSSQHGLRFTHKTQRTQNTGAIRRCVGLYCWRRSSANTAPHGGLTSWPPAVICWREINNDYKGHKLASVFLDLELKLPIYVILCLRHPCTVAARFRISLIKLNISTV